LGTDNNTYSFEVGTGVLTFSDLGANSELVSLEGVTSGTTDYDVDAEVEGTFHGLDGTYECTTGAGCMVTAVAGGGYVTTGDWTFTPEDFDAAETEVTVDDQDYMHFGFWLNESTDDDGATAMANAFFGGTEASDPTTLQSADMEGSAKYMGPASGLYVLNTFDTQGNSTPAAAGQFTATANLTAVFGEPTSVGSDAHDGISGTITSFMANGEMIDPDWSLDLSKADLGSDEVFGGTTQPTGAETASGNWRGQFFGEAEAMANGDDVFPTGVAGEFTGHFQNGDVLGGFAAEYQEEE
jgi:hypothetical protein